jgi:tRNA threonylcarbamoyladenosine biosynthesis protein TsaE
MTAAGTNQTATLIVPSLEATNILGNAMGRALPDRAVVLFRGEMAAGKTTMIKAVCAGLGVVPEIVISPTYTLTNIYQGRLPIYHVDLYRLESPEELDYLDPDDWLNPAGPTLIEWPEVAQYYLQDLDTLTLRLQVHADIPEKREVTLTASHPVYDDFIAKLTQIELP